MSPSYISRLVNGKYQVVQIEVDALFCPYCESSELELTNSFESIISGVPVEWRTCQACRTSIEFINGVATKESL